MPSCSHCGATASENAVLCIECGYDFRTRKRHTTEIDRSPDFVDFQPGIVANIGRVVLGWLATFLFTVCFIPQIIKTLKTKTVEGLSFWLLFIQFVANIIALWYASLIAQPPLPKSPQQQPLPKATPASPHHPSIIVLCRLPPDPLRLPLAFPALLIAIATACFRGRPSPTSFEMFPDTVLRDDPDFSGITQPSN